MNTENLSGRESYWKGRAESYDKLNWVYDSSYLDTLITAGEFCETDKVLDVGTGIGVVAEALLPLVAIVVGIDISLDMLPSQGLGMRQIIYQRCDIKDLPSFYEDSFNKVTARMVFHHIIEGTWLAMDKCYDALEPGGKMVLAEGVPPTDEVIDWYRIIMRLKENRLCFREDDLVSLMSESGFKNIKVYPHVIKQFSVKNWLQNNGLPEDTQEEIYSLHTKAPDIFKQAYNMTITEDDCLIDTKNLILVGEK